MHTRFSFRWLALLVLLAALIAPARALAGGWVVVTLDRLPETVTAGQPYSLGLTARQHGRTPFEVEELVIEARQAGSRQVLRFSALPQGRPGHYQAELLFPDPGTWEWGIASGLYPDLQPMPALEVSGEAGAAIASQNSPRGALAGLALLALAGGFVLVWRRGAARLAAPAGIGLLLLAGALAVGLYASDSAAQAARAEPDALAGAGDPVQAGRRLFLAKGCVVCHVNERALKNSAQYGVESGPNLSAYRNDPDYLHTFLKDPQAARPGIDMPNLELKKDEIDALVSFLNAAGE